MVTGSGICGSLADGASLSQAWFLQFNLGIWHSSDMVAMMVVLLIYYAMLFIH